MADEEFTRYQEIRHLADRVESLGRGYAHANYNVRLDDETKALSDRDLLLLCDGGNAHFGGKVLSRLGGAARVKIYTD